MATDEAKFSIRLDSNAGEVTDEAAKSLEKLRASIQASEQNLKDMGAQLRRLKGNSDEIKAAKVDLKAKIDAEKNALAAANIELVKAGVSFEKLTAAAKKAAQAQAEAKKKADDLKADRASAMAAAFRAAGGPVADLRDKLASIKEVAGGAGGAMGVATFAIVGTVAAVAALTVAGVGLLAMLGRWIVVGANAARTAQLLREAVTPTGEDARRLGDHIDVLSKKVPIAKDRLNEMAVSLAKQRLSGQTVVDTLNAVAQATAGLGEDAGAKVRELVGRGQISQRFQLNPYELLGSGLDFNDVAKQLAASMHVGVEQARAALFEGRVKLSDGAAALRAAVEAKVGRVNLSRMLDLNVMSQKFHETLDKLTSGVNLEPLLEGLKDIASVFDTSTFTGSALKELITQIGNGFGGMVKDSAPAIKEFIIGFITGLVKLHTEYLRLKLAFREAFGGTGLEQVDVLKVALVAGEAAAKGMAFGLIVTARSVLLIVQAAKWLKGAFVTIGESLATGLAGGIDSTTPVAVDAAIRQSQAVLDASKKTLDSHSPSRKYRELGVGAGQGTVLGLEAETPAVQRAAAKMIELPPPPTIELGAPGGPPMPEIPTASAPSSSTSTHAVSVGPVHVYVQGGGDGAAKALTDSGFVAQFTKALEDACRSVGVPVGAT